MRSCDELRREHEAIGNVLAAVEGGLPLVGDGHGLPRPALAAAVEFFTSYVERCHEAKEEQAFIPVLIGCGALDPDTLRRIEHDHGEGRRLLQALDALCTRGPIDGEVGRLLGGYVALQRRHLAFEDESVFPRADQVLSASDDARVLRAFQTIEERVVGSEGPSVLLALAGALTEAWHAVRGARPRAWSALAAHDLLSPGQAMVAPGDSLARAGELMGSVGTRELPVVEHGAVVGIITRTDMEPHQGHLEWTTVRTAMTADPLTVAPDTPLATVAGLLLDRGFNSVPVTEGHRLVGMIRRSDLLRALAEGRP